MLTPLHGPSQERVVGEADLGYRVLRRHWRQGYASEQGEVEYELRREDGERRGTAR